MSIVYTYDKDGYHVGQTVCQPNPRKPGEYLLPANSTTIDPGTAPQDKVMKFDGTLWVAEDIPAPIVPTPTQEELELQLTYNEYGVVLKEISGTTVVDRDQADVDSETDTAAWTVLRNQRTGLIFEVEWMKARHEDETTLSLTTTLTGTEHTELLEYIQDLRAITDSVTDPVTWLAIPAWPTKPTFV